MHVSTKIDVNYIVDLLLVSHAGLFASYTERQSEFKV